MGGGKAIGAWRSVRVMGCVRAYVGSVETEMFVWAMKSIGAIGVVRSMKAVRVQGRWRTIGCVRSFTALSSVGKLQRL